MTAERVKAAERERRLARRRRSGSSSPARTCSASRSPRRTVAWGWASSSCACCSRRSGARWRPAPGSRRWCTARCRSPSSAARRSAGPGCRASRPARRSSRAALEDAGSAEGAAPATRARATAARCVLDGAKRAVPGARRRRPAAGARERRARRRHLPGGSEGARASRSRRRVISTGEPLFDVTLSGVRVAAAARLGGAGCRRRRDAAPGSGRAPLVALAALQVGVSDRALRITAEYVKERVQFGVPIGSFQAVQHREADGFIDLEAMRWTTLARGLAAGRGPARRARRSGREVLGGRGRLAHREREPAPARRPRLRRRLSRSTATSCGPRRSSSSGGGASATLARLGRDLARTGPGETSMKATRRFEDVKVGEELPPLDVATTAALVVGGALASRDFTPVHHDKAAAQAQGLPDVFMNILTTNGFVGRYVTDWAGPDALRARHQDQARRPEPAGRHARRSAARCRRRRTASSRSRSPATTRGATTSARP